MASPHCSITESHIACAAQVPSCGNNSTYPTGVPCTRTSARTESYADSPPIGASGCVTSTSTSLIGRYTCITSARAVVHGGASADRPRSPQSTADSDQVGSMATTPDVACDGYDDPTTSRACICQ